MREHLESERRAKQEEDRRNARAATVGRSTNMAELESRSSVGADPNSHGGGASTQKARSSSSAQDVKQPHEVGSLDTKAG